MKKLLLILLSLCLLLMLVSCGETVLVTGATVDENGDLIVTFSDGTTQNAGKVKGEDGKDGAAADAENPQGLDFYPLPDGTWAVSAGKALYLEEVTIPATYKGKAVTCIGGPDGSDNEFGGGGFRGAVNLKKITMPDSITHIGEYAFYGCSSLQSITIPNGVTSIGFRAFVTCSSLQSVTIPNGVTHIGGLAFYGCSSLQSVTIPSSVTDSGGGEFLDCSNLSNVYFTGTEAQWNAISEHMSIPQSATVTYNYTA